MSCPNEASDVPDMADETGQLVGMTGTEVV